MSTDLTAMLVPLPLPHFHFDGFGTRNAASSTRRTAKRCLPEQEVLNHQIRLKKRKVHHTIRSVDLLQPDQYRGRGTRPLHSWLESATNQWTPSKMCPSEDYWTGHVEAWQTGGQDLYEQFEELCFSSPLVLAKPQRPVLKRQSLPLILHPIQPVEQVKALLVRSSRSTSAPPALAPGDTNEIEALASQAALKAQLISALRYRLGPATRGETSLVLRKYVAWNGRL